MLRRAEKDRQYVIVAPTYTMLRDIVWPVFLHLGRELRFIRSTILSRLTCTLGNGAVILFRSADRPDRLRGLTNAGAWLDEASLMEREVLEVVMLALRERAGAWLACTFTPKGKSHWTYELFGRPRADVTTVTAPTASNPFLPEDFIGKARGNITTQLARQELDAEFVDQEGADWPSIYWGDWVFATALPPRSRWTASAIAVDPSLGKQDRRGDYSAIVLLVIADDLLWVQADLQRRSPQKLIADTLVLCDQYQPNFLGFEANQFQELLVHEFERVSRNARALARGVFQIRNNVNKLLRIRRLGPYIVRRELRVIDDLGGRLLVQQLQEFPTGKHDDGPDALEMAIRLIMEAAAHHGTIID